MKHAGGRPSHIRVFGSSAWFAAKYGITVNQAVKNRNVLIRLADMKPEARRYMLKLVREGR